MDAVIRAQSAYEVFFTCLVPLGIGFVVATAVVVSNPTVLGLTLLGLLGIFIILLLGASIMIRIDAAEKTIVLALHGQTEPLIRTAQEEIHESQS